MVQSLTEGEIILSLEEVVLAELMFSIKASNQVLPNI